MGREVADVAVYPGPVAPVDPLAPVGPVRPVFPVGPAAPAAPVAPVGPVAPVAPVIPATLINQSACVPPPDVEVTATTRVVPEYDVILPKKQAVGAPELQIVTKDNTPGV